MKIDRQLRLRDRKKSEINGAISAAIYGKQTSDELSAKICDILYTTMPKGAPGHLRAYLSGYYDYFRNNILYTKLEFCYRVNGALYSTYKNSPRYYEKLGLSPKQVYDLADFSGHYWENSDKLYFGDKIDH